jgi:hypothetical protein
VTLRKLEGFEGQRNMVILARHYATATGTIATEIGHRGNNSGVSSANLLLRTVDLLDGATDENSWVLGWAMRLNSTNGFSAAATVIPYVSFRSSAGEQLRVEFIAFNETKPGGNRYKLRVMRGATTLATTNESFDGNTTEGNWTYFEFEAVIRTSTNGSFSLRFHDRFRKNVTATWTAANTGVNTANQGADGADRYEVALTQNPATSIAIDDMYCVDGTGSLYNTKVGEIEIEAVTISGNGATDDWDLQGAAASVEDAWNEGAVTQSTTEDDKRVSTTSVGEIELGALTNPTIIRNVAVLGVETRLSGKMEATGTRDVQFFYRKTTGTPAQVGTKTVTLSSTSLITHADPRETDPNTSAAWVVADIDGLQVGAKLTA